MNLCALILKTFGWKVDVTTPDFPKSIICVAPHTSNWDFILCELAYTAIGRKAGFLMKDTWFFFPLGPIFKAIGGIPVPRKKKGESLTNLIVNKFNTSNKLTLAITPEGTRSLTTRWHTGFLHIAREANVPVCLAVLDFPSKTIFLHKTFVPTGDTEADLKAIKAYYRPFKGLYPDKFSTD